MSALGWMGLLLAAAAPAADTRAPAPHAGCVDTRAVLEARHLDERTVLLKTAEAGYRVELAETCPPSVSGDLVALAPHGWVCGGDSDGVYYCYGWRFGGIGEHSACFDKTGDIAGQADHHRATYAQCHHDH